MAHPRIRAFIDNGPRGGEHLVVDADEDGGPPQTITLPDPAPPPMRIEEGPPVIVPPSRSEYVLTDLDEGNGEHIYRLRRPG